MRQALAVLLLVAAMGAWAAWRPPRIIPAPPRLPLSAAQAWMADCLPGVGAKTRAAVAADLRRGDLAQLSQAARDRLDVFFAAPPMAPPLPSPIHPPPPGEGRHQPADR